jgi:hypothetical protein
MNDNDLERQLRAQAGPREEGYVPARLPASLEEAPVRRPSPLLRAAVLVPAVAAGVLAVAVVGAVLRGSGNANVGAPGASSPSAAPSVSGIGDCAPGDLTLTAEPWGGAAGSRGTVITLTLAGQVPCVMSTHVAGRLTDSAGATVIDTVVGLRNIEDTSKLEPGASYSIGVSWSNWCDSAPKEPLDLAIRPPSMNSWLAVPVPAGGVDPVPPCMGSNDTALNLTKLQPAH